MFCRCPETFSWCHPWPIAFSCCPTNPISSCKATHCWKGVPQCWTRAIPNSLELWTFPQHTTSLRNKHHPLQILIHLVSTSTALNCHLKLWNHVHANNQYNLWNCQKISSKVCSRFLGRMPTCEKAWKHRTCIKCTEVICSGSQTVKNCKNPCRDCRKTIGCKGRNSKRPFMLCHLVWTDLNLIWFFIIHLSKYL